MTGEAKHTPGPWYPGHHTDETSILDEGYVGGIATIHEHNGIDSISRGGNDCPPHAEAVANAHLISAAPELKGVARAGIELIEGNLTGAEWKQACAEFLRIARAAEAKAEGRDQ